MVRPAARGRSAPGAAQDLGVALIGETAAPWLLPLAGPGRRVDALRRAGASMAEALDALGGARRFVAPGALPPGEAYEAFVARTGCVPTRDNLHDGYNGLIWLTQPALKARLNALQAQAIARDGVGSRRGALRDALTLFDEFGAWIEAPPELVDALRRRDWSALFVQQRERWREARVHLVGHALLEQLTLAPRKGLTAHVHVGDPSPLEAATWATKPFCPLPVLGIPGWWPANEEPGFYDDGAVFRPAKSLRGAGAPPAAP